MGASAVGVRDHLGALPCVVGVAVLVNEAADVLGISIVEEQVDRLLFDIPHRPRLVILAP